MDFIFWNALLSEVGTARDSGVANSARRKERIVKNVSSTQAQELFLLEVERSAAEETHEQFTPGDFFQEAGTVIAICLALGMLMQLLLA